MPHTRPRLRPSLRATLACVAVAVLTSLLFDGFGRAIEQRRLDQLSVVRIETACYRLTSLLGSGRRGGSVQGFEAMRADVESHVEALKLSEDGRDVSTLRELLKPFYAAAAAEVREIRRGDLPAARLLDANAVAPAYAPASAVISRIVEKHGRAAEAWTRRIKIASTVGMLAWALVVATLFSWYQAKIAALVGSEAKKDAAEAGEERLRSLIQNSADVIAVAGADGTLKMVSEPAKRIWERDPDDLLERSLYDYVHVEDRERLEDAVANVLGGNADYGVQVRILDGRDAYRPFRAYLADLTADPNVQGLLLTFHDLTERQAYEDELAYHAFHDRLTGLPNRSLFLDRLSQRMKSGARDKSPYAVLFIDLDNFKVINDSLGHAAGDELLVNVVERFSQVADPTDTVARLGGDEFTVLLDCVETAEEAIDYAERLKRALQIPVSVCGREVFVTASVGIAMCDEVRCDASDMLRDADTAMYHAKGNGKSGHALFDPSMNEYAVERLELETDLRAAIGLDQLVVFYQPIVDMETGETREVEALLRWNHPTRGLIPPLKFVPIAEETGLINEIGRWVLHESCRQLVAWEAEEPAAKRIGLSVNVSGKQFQQPDFVEQVREALKETGLCPRRLALEVTETATLEDLSRMSALFEELREIGVRISIDDFGTGYSSISYLSRLPIDTLKIDRSFVSGLGLDERADGLVQAIVTMAKTLGLRVTSEGIETVNQYGALKSLGCDSGQGYLFAKPQPLSHLCRVRSQEAPSHEARRAA